MAEKNTISVVMTTYNGEKYVEAQLQSILRQTRLPDELIVMDDCSTDQTPAIVERLIKARPDIACRLVRNEKNMGWRANFVSGFHLAKGDLIFCADQDDIWMENKLELMENEMLRHPEILVLACNLEPFYEENAVRLAPYYVKPYGRERLARVPFGKQGLTVIRQGCCLCFRRSLLPLFDRVWQKELAHDEVLFSLGKLKNGLYILNVPLIRFRRHGENNSPSNVKSLARRTELVKIDCIHADNLVREARQIGIDAKAEKQLKKYRRFAHKRLAALEKCSLAGVFGLLPSLPFYQRPRAWAADALCVWKK